MIIQSALHKESTTIIKKLSQQGIKKRFKIVFKIKTLKNRIEIDYTKKYSGVSSDVAQCSFSKCTAKQYANCGRQC